MDFGLGLMGYHGCWDDARFGEEHGFASAGLVDSQLLGGEMFACLALAAQATERMRLGTFLAIPSNRIAPIAAQGIATINRLAPGRTFLAMGSGYTGRNTMGLPALPAARVRDYARECRALLDGEEILFRDGQRERWIRFAHRDDDAVSYVNTRDRIPVYIAGDGPKALAAVGQAGDGWVTTLQFAPMMSPQAAEVYASSFAAVRAAAAEAGRTFDEANTMMSTTLCVLRPGESPTDPRVLERVGAYAMMVFHTTADRPGAEEHLPPEWRERWHIYRERVLERFPASADRRHQWIHRGHLSHLQDGEAEVLTDDIVRATTLTGTADEIVERVRALEAAGLRNLTLWFPPHQTREGVVEVEEQIAPRMAGATAAG